MSDEIRINRQPNPGGQQPVARQETAAQAETEAAGGPSKMPWVILAAIVLVLIVLGVTFRDKLFTGTGGEKSAMNATKPSGYQAVFLTNGQVYFGKLSDVESSYVTLKDIYYLQVGPAQGSGSATNTPQNITLVKLGQELHGPVDEMHISRSQILFYEDLKAEGNVVSAIMKDKAAGQGK